MNILFLVPYPIDTAPSQRFRIEKLLFVLDDAGYGYTVEPFLDVATYQVLYKSGGGWLKAKGILAGYMRRLRRILALSAYDIVFIHREAAPLGPPVFEWAIKKLWRKKIIYDFDDAIWIENTSKENRLANWVKCFWKVKYICRWADVISAGNDFLSNFSKAHAGGKVIKMPTVVNTEQYQKRSHGDEWMVIGWTGTHSTLKYLTSLIPVFQKLALQYSFNVVVIADKDPCLPVPNYQFIEWNKETEIKDLARLDIGVMPLAADAWAEGKCGFKIIQYMALGIATVASPIGVNKLIIEDGVNGCLCNDADEWYTALEKLINSVEHRSQFTKAGREKIEGQYSIKANAGRFLSLFGT
jgi:glycosyltransferase involved in cell wall biosynthesis